MRSILRSLPVALAALLLPAPAARAADLTVTSFDGTAITVHWFPQPGGQPAPTILLGHGWGGSGDVNEAPGQPISRFRAAGYNVLTWDARGFGTSGGTVEVDSADFEGRDVQALLDWLAQRPEAQLDAPGDPRVGMAGGSYGGGIQLVTAAIDKRVDAITPQIAWHSLGTSLYPDSIVKLGWSGLLYASAAQKQLDPHIRAAFDQGTSTGALDAETRSWFLARGPGDALVSRITAPTLLVQGTVDALFPLDEAVANYRILRKNNVPTKLLWYCGGHGVCLDGHPDSARADAAVLTWLDKYVKRDAAADTGARFEGVDQRGQVFTAPDYPLPARGALTAKGAGTLKLKAAGGAGPTTRTTGPIAGITPARAKNAVNVRLRTGKRGDRIVGAPKVTLAYRGTTGKGTRPQRVFAQLVDTRTGLVLGNQITPIPVRLDGKRHTVSRPLELVAQTLRGRGGITLQLVATTPAYAKPQLGGKVRFSAVTLRLPRVRG
jgi:ABC-2 type transport system ATP-binding protein